MRCCHAAIPFLALRCGTRLARLAAHCRPRLFRMEAAAAGSASARPKVIVFDLDGCVWWPEMYMLWGIGEPGG